MRGCESRRWRCPGVGRYWVDRHRGQEATGTEAPLGFELPIGRHGKPPVSNLLLCGGGSGGDGKAKNLPFAKLQCGIPRKLADVLA
jgi:hypothetical protein